MIRPDDVTDAMRDAALSKWFDVPAPDETQYLRAFHAAMCETIAAAVNASGCVLVPFDDGKLWSFLRSVLSQGGCIWADYQKSSFELYSARLDAAAAERATELRAMLAAADPREQALDRMAENAQELGLYDEGKESNK